MKILVACEESQAVTIKLRRRGHEAYSCDVLECSGGHPEWHIKDDVRNYLHRQWDMIIAFPPCTHLCVSGARWFSLKIDEQAEAISFFMGFIRTSCRKVAIENPVGIMSTQWRKPSQIIHPWQFGHSEQKKTCLWLKGLPLLKPTKNVYDHMMTLPKSQRERIHWLGGRNGKGSFERSKTYIGIAEAMANQWTED